MAVVLDSKLHAAFLQHYFGAGGKATSIESVWAAYQYPVAEGDDASAVALCLLVKIAAVAAAECTGGRSTLAVRVQDSSAKEADLVLLDDQIELAQLMAEGDSLALINPFMRATKGLPSSSCPAEILVGSQTLVFIVPAPPAVAQETVPLSQYPEPNRMGKMVAAAAADTVDMVIPVNSKGALDCRFVGVPIRTADLRPGMVNVTLIAVVESVEPPSLAQDDLLNDPQQPVSFYSIRVNDSNGSGVAVRVPNDHAVKSKVHSPRRFLPGHVVLLEHVSVSRAMTITCHGSVVNISILQGTSQSRGLLALGGPLQMVGTCSFFFFLNSFCLGCSNGTIDPGRRHPARNNTKAAATANDVPVSQAFRERAGPSPRARSLSAARDGPAGGGRRRWRRAVVLCALYGHDPDIAANDVEF